MKRVETIFCVLVLILATACGIRWSIDRIRFSPLSFETLSAYKYEIPDDNFIGPTNDQIPPDIRALNGRLVVISGSMVPCKLDNQKQCTQFILVDAEANLPIYHRMPKINEWLSVDLPSGVSVPMSDEIRVYGAFEVGETYEKGELLSIYRIKTERVSIPTDSTLPKIFTGK